MNLPGRIVVLGGYGRFGARICRALAKSGQGELCIAGRCLDRARRLAETLEAEYPGSRVSAVALDHQDPRFVRHLGRIAPIVVVHTAGPFQAQDYTVAEACLACRSHYLDLADGRRFVADFVRFDREAQRRDVLLVSGASTLPGVSSAVVNELKHGMSSVASIETSIVPANRTRRGEATIAAVLSYCGKPFKVFEDGAWIDRFGWHDARSIRYPLFERRVAACDVPDLELFPAHYAGVETVTFHAGPELAWQHLGLRLMAALARAGVVRDWSRHARLVNRVDDSTRHFGSDTGVMRVRVSGSVVVLNAYVIVKLIHIVSAAVLFGTGLGTAFFMFKAHGSRNIEVIIATSRHVVLADWLFTLPAVIVQLSTGLWLTSYLQIPWSSVWFATVMTMFTVVGLCWLPVVAIQIWISRLARAGLEGTNARKYASLMRAWIGLGVPGFVLTLGLFALMVLKPGIG